MSPKFTQLPGTSSVLELRYTLERAEEDVVPCEAGGMPAEFRFPEKNVLGFPNFLFYMMVEGHPTGSSGVGMDAGSARYTWGDRARESAYGGTCGA